MSSPPLPTNIHQHSLHTSPAYLTRPHSSRGFPIPNASTLIRDSLRAGNLLERNIRIIRTAKPIESPVAASLQLLREGIALGFRRNTTVLRSPAVGWRAPLVGAGVVQADAAAGHGEVEVVLAEIAARVGSLDDHLLAIDGAGCECQSWGK